LDDSRRGRRRAELCDSHSIALRKRGQKWEFGKRKGARKSALGDDIRILKLEPQTQLRVQGFDRKLRGSRNTAERSIARALAKRLRGVEGIGVLVLFIAVAEVGPIEEIEELRIQPYFGALANVEMF